MLRFLIKSWEIDISPHFIEEMEQVRSSDFPTLKSRLKECEKIIRKRCGELWGITYLCQKLRFS